MWFWWFIVICNLIVPIIMIVVGKIMSVHCPKEINGIIGYRTRRSMKNEETWKFAHSYCGRLWWILGWIMVIPSIVAQIPFYNGTYEIIGIVGAIVVAVQCAILILSVIPTEIALKKVFPDDGTRR